MQANNPYLGQRQTPAMMTTSPPAGYGWRQGPLRCRQVALGRQQVVNGDGPGLQKLANREQHPQLQLQSWKPATIDVPQHQHGVLLLLLTALVPHFSPAASCAALTASE